MNTPCLSCSTRGGARNAHRARGLCDRCYNRLRNRGELTDYPAISRTRDEVLTELDHLGFDPRQPIQAQLREFAPRIGMTVAALNKAYYRAAKAGAA